MRMTPQEATAPAQTGNAAPRFGRRTLLKGAGGVAALGVLGGGVAWRRRQPLQTLGGHTDLVRRVAFSPDGATLADVSYDGTVRLWRVSDGQLLRTFGSSTDIFRALAFAPDGATLMAGGSDIISIWRVGDGAPMRTIGAANDTSPNAPGGSGSQFFGIYDLAYAPDGSLIASGMLTGTLYLWGASDGQLVRKIMVSKNRAEEVGSVAFSPDGQIVAAGLRDSTGQSAFAAVQLLRVSDGMVRKTLPVKGTEVTGLSFSPDGQTLLAGAASPQVHGDDLVDFWRVRDGVSRQFPLVGAAAAPVFAPDGLTFAVARSSEALVRRLDGTVVHRVTARGEVVGIAFSPDGRLLATASNQGRQPGTAQIWQLR